MSRWCLQKPFLCNVRALMKKTDTTKINRGYLYGEVVCSFACVPFCMEPGHGHGDHCFFFQTPFVDCKRCSHKKA